MRLRESRFDNTLTIPSHQSGFDFKNSRFKKSHIHPVQTVQTIVTKTFQADFKGMDMCSSNPGRLSATVLPLDVIGLTFLE